MHSFDPLCVPSDLPGVNPAILNGMLLYYRLMTKWSGLGDSTELFRVRLSHRATITSPSSPSLPHARLNSRHSSTLYDVHEPRLRLGRGKLGKHSGRLRQAQSTRGEGQASRREQPNPATRRLPRQGIATRLQCTPTDSDVRRDVPTATHCNSLLFPLVTLPLGL
jgi:hypothetical protein